MHLLMLTDLSGKIHGAEDGTSIGFHNLFEQKPASGRSKQRPDGLYEHQYARNLSEPYFSVSGHLKLKLPYSHAVRLEHQA